MAGRRASTALLGSDWTPDVLERPLDQPIGRARHVQDHAECNTLRRELLQVMGDFACQVMTIVMIIPARREQVA